MTDTVQVPDYAIREQVTVDPTTTALIVVDMQNDFVREGFAGDVTTAAGIEIDSAIPAAGG